MLYEQRQNSLTTSVSILTVVRTKKSDHVAPFWRICLESRYVRQLHVTHAESLVWILCGLWKEVFV